MTIGLHTTDNTRLNVMNLALENTEKIKSVFLAAQLFFATHDNMPALINYLENTEPEFRSVAYESVSMAIALKTFETGNFPGEWLAFASGAARAHTAQVYVGLGWAIAKLNLPFLETIKPLELKLYFRIADGCGYYDGSFRRRQTILSQQLPAYLPVEVLPMYYQGVGRSIWYMAKTAIPAILSVIKTFPANTQPDLWRGIGIAVAYVGGCSTADLIILWHCAGVNGPQLACGAALAARARLLADTMTADTERCSYLWYAVTKEKLELNKHLQMPSISNTDKETYLNWIMQTEAILSGSFKKGV